MSGRGRALKFNLAGVVAVVAAAALSAGVLARDQGGSASAAGAPAGGGTLALFARAQTPRDELAHVPAGSVSRLAYDSGGLKVFAVSEPTGDVCLVVRTAGASRIGCTPLASAMSDRPLVMIGSDDGQPLAVGLLHDGPAHVDVARSSTAGPATRQPVTGNVFVVRGPASAVSWRDDDGSRHEQSVAAYRRPGT
ncbi:MAG: hypothetical protein QOD69_96 [Solirubrobacteraceae bacterium]|nr:hypothetical protein [Solirubrobacteraceae bacterium]